MPMSRMPAAAVPPDPFSDVRTRFEAILTRASTGPLMGATHGEVEDALWTDGMELLRGVFQGHLDLRAAQEEPTPVRGADGDLRTHVRKTERKLETRFGTVEVHRASLGHREVPALFPMDAELNLPPEQASHGVQLRVAEEVARGSFGEAVDAVKRTTAAEVAKRQLEHLAERAACDFDAFYASREVRPEAPSDLVVLSFDGKGIVMRPEDLRPATRKAATEGRHKLGKRLSKGEKRNRKRMAVVAAVYAIARWVRPPQAVVGDLHGAHGEVGPRPVPANKRVWASVEKEPKDVIREAFEEAERRDPAHARRWVVLVDGNPTQIRVATAEARRRGIALTIVLDVIHVLEYLWDAAWCFFSEGDPAAEVWVTLRLDRILKGNVSQVAAGIRRSATKRGIDEIRRKNADKCSDYLLKYRRYLHYDVVLREGLPLATGVIEGACRHLVKDRMDLTGARWTLAGAEAVLRLRALHASGDLHAYWSFHQQRELERNHVALYDPAHLPGPLRQPDPSAPGAGVER